MARFRDLPPELVAAILAVLPVDSLMQSKCVQNPWCSLISHPSFVTKQLHNQIRSKNTGVLFKGLIVTGTGKVKDFLSFLSFDKKAGTSAGQDHVSAVWKTVDFPFFRELMFCSFLGHCHGIIFLAFCNGELLLANLATREIKALPETLILPSVGSRGLKKFPACVGFGYDLKSNDYEVVIIHRVIDNSVFHRVKVYTLSTKSWREVNTMNILGTDNFDFVGFGGLYINGASYWLAYGDFFKEHTKFILSFDMSDEVFQKLSMPCYDEGEDFRLMVFNESLAYLHNTSSVLVHSQYGYGMNLVPMQLGKSC